MYGTPFLLYAIPYVDVYKRQSQRFEVAKLLIQKKTYSEIEESTGASTATISRINRTLQFGADGYTAVLERLKAKEEASE